jgi:flavin-dependent dehydrogenase
MAGDAAGMITPLCGNGMAIAIHSAKILSALVASYCKGELSRAMLETAYRKSWNESFRQRLWFGRNLQHLLGYRTFSSLVLKLAQLSKPVSRIIVRGTHGNPF